VTMLLRLQTYAQTLTVHGAARLRSRHDTKRSYLLLTLLEVVQDCLCGDYSALCKERRTPCDALLLLVVDKVGVGLHAALKAEISALLSKVTFRALLALAVELGVEHYSGVVLCHCIEV